MKFFFLLLLFFLSAHIIYAQDRSYSSNNREAIKYFAIANQSLDDRLYDDAIDNLKRSITEDSKFIEAHLLLADVYRARWRYKEAIKEFKLALSLNPEFNRSAYYKLGDCEEHDADYADAQTNLEKYLAYPNLNQQTVFYAQKWVREILF